jgi:NTP pyrophosphatase (non-canonical NTP hydrolase)
MYYIYHIPDIKKIGCTNNLERRVEKEQGWKKNEYEILFASSDIDKASKVELELQNIYRYKKDVNEYKTLIKMKLNSTQQTTTFYCSKKNLTKELLLGKTITLDDQVVDIDTNEKAKWIIKNSNVSMFDKDKCFVYNKAMKEAFAQKDIDIFSMFDNIRQWADQRGIYEQGDPKTQLIKLYEETGELAQAILKDNKEDIVDAIGDSVVVLTNLAHLVNTDIETCIGSAYDEISSRTGRMKNGTFVKDTL